MSLLEYFIRRIASLGAVVAKKSKPATAPRPPRRSPKAVRPGHTVSDLKVGQYCPFRGWRNDLVHDVAVTGAYRWSGVGTFAGDLEQFVVNTAYLPEGKRPRGLSHTTTTGAPSARSMTELVKTAKPHRPRGFLCDKRGTWMFVRSTAVIDAGYAGYAECLVPEGKHGTWIHVVFKGTPESVAVLVVDGEMVAIVACLMEPPAWPGDDAHEPAATKALAHLLNASPRIAQAFLDLVSRTGIAAFTPGRITREEQHGELRPDLTIRDTNDALRVLVENKLWARLTDAQPVDYLRTLPADASSGLVFIVPQQRVHDLWAELREKCRCNAVELTGERTADTIIWANSGHRTLAITSWERVLTRLEEAVRAGGHLTLRRDIAKLRGRIDRDEPRRIAAAPLAVGGRSRS